MRVSAKLNYLRIAPRKVRLVADLIRGKSVDEARSILNFTVKKSTIPMLKLLNQAVSNAKNNFSQEEQSDHNLYISEIRVDEGPKLKRWRPRARGQAYEIQKKTSHITIVLDQIDKDALKKPVKKTSKKEEEIKEEKTVSKDTVKTKKEKPKLKPEAKKVKPKTETGVKKIFKRKAF